MHANIHHHPNRRRRRPSVRAPAFVVAARRLADAISRIGVTYCTCANVRVFECVCVCIVCCRCHSGAHAFRLRFSYALRGFVAQLHDTLATCAQRILAIWLD